MLETIDSIEKWRDITRLTLDQVIALAQDYCDNTQHGLGGSLHIVLEDGNLEDKHLEWCVKTAIENHDPAGIVLAREIQGLSMQNRKRLWGVVST